MEEIRFFAIATTVLFGATAILMVGAIRKRLLPVHELAMEADMINSGNWVFHAPASAKGTLELQPLARALEAALERVQRSFEQQRRFTSDAAHELKTDVAIVKSSLQLLSMRKRSIEEYGEGLILSLRDCDRLEETVQKLLTLARLEQPEEISSNGNAQHACSLREAAEEAVHQSESLAQLRSIDVEVDAQEDAFVPLDRRDAVLLCANLLVNALQHSAKQGRVLLSLAQKGSNIMFTVQDWGEGIAEEDRPHLFHPFYRGDVSRSRKSGGTGLGLSICKAICDRAEGSIDISNHAGGGALVTVMLPSCAGPFVCVAGHIQLPLRRNRDTQRAGELRPSLDFRSFTMRAYQGVVAAALLSFAAAAAAQTYHVADKWRLGGQGGWDYLLSDDAAHRLYVTHNSRVEVVDSSTGKPVGAITGLKSTHGVALNPDGKTGYISDGAGNAIVVFDRKSSCGSGNGSRRNKS